jgi:histidyl-tRNA synthetase
VAKAPTQIDHLCEPCTEHLDRVRAGLEALAIPFKIEPLLVRGLDYYTRTTFEYAGAALESAQNALGGGGRYDGLVTALGGPDTPAIGFALGIERILLAAEAEGVAERLSKARRVDAFVVDFSGGEAARDLTARLRAAGIRCDRAYDSRSPKAQLKAADRSGARLALIIGPDEAASGKVTIKDMTSDADQVTVGADEVVDEVRDRLHL